jgi:hypothetical protein
MRSDERNARRGPSGGNSGSGPREIVSGPSGTVSDRDESGSGTPRPAIDAIGTSIGARGSYSGTRESYIGARGSYSGAQMDPPADCAPSPADRPSKCRTRVSARGTSSRMTGDAAQGCVRSNRDSRPPIYMQFAQGAVRAARERVSARSASRRSPWSASRTPTGDRRYYVTAHQS